METRPRFSSTPALAGALILVMAALAAGCGVSKSKYLEAEKARDDAMAKNQQLQSSLDQANKDKTVLASDKQALDGRVKELEASTQQLQGQLQEQQKSSEDFKSTYDQMLNQLKTEVSSGQVEVQQLRDGISVNLEQDILFPTGSANLDKKGRVILLKVADQLKSSKFQVLVTGHTDNQKIGAALASRYPSNWELGGARASSIVRLFEGAGIDKARLAAVSFADSRPREANDTAEGRAKNRRIEIRLRPVASD